MAEMDVQAGIKKFHAHLDTCGQCRNNPFGLCSTGARLLKEAATHPDIPEALRSRPTRALESEGEYEGNHTH